MICTGTKEELVVLSDKTAYLVTRLSADDIAKREKAEHRTHWAKIVAEWLEDEEKRPPEYRSRAVDYDLGRKLNPIEWYDAHYREAVEAGAMFQPDIRKVDRNFLRSLDSYLDDSDPHISSFFPTESAYADTVIARASLHSEQLIRLGSTLRQRAFHAKT